MALIAMILSLFVSVSQPALAANQDLEKIEQTVLAYLKQKADQQLFEPEFKLRPVSQRLKLAKCQTDLQIDDRNLNEKVGRMTIGVICNQPKWKVYIPAEIQGKLEVVYSNRAILRNTLISAEDIRIERLPYNQIPNGSALRPESVIGMRSKRSFTANSPIQIKYLQPPYWVFKNRNVNILTRIGSIEVKTQGVAMKNAVKGEQVPVKNINSNRVVKGIVIAPNTVMIP